MRLLHQLGLLLLWLQFLKRRLFGFLLKYYGLLWVTLAIFWLAALLMLITDYYQKPSQYNSILPWIIGGVLAVSGGYLYGMTGGSSTNQTFSIAAPILILMYGPPNHFRSLLQWEWPIVIKGLFVFGALLILTIVAYKLAPFVYNLASTPDDGYRIWPHRRAITFVAMVSSLPALEILRLSAGVFPSMTFPWSRSLHNVLTEPQWPLAIFAWVCFNFAYLLSQYEHELLPALLRRVGYRLPYELSVNDRLSLINDSMIEKLIEELKEGKLLL